MQTKFVSKTLKPNDCSNNVFNINIVKNIHISSNDDNQSITNTTINSSIVNVKISCINPTNQCTKDSSKQSIIKQQRPRPSILRTIKSATDIVLSPTSTQEQTVHHSKSPPHYPPPQLSMYQIHRPQSHPNTSPSDSSQKKRIMLMDDDEDEQDSDDQISIIHPTQSHHHHHRFNVSSNSSTSDADEYYSDNSNNNRKIFEKLRRLSTQTSQCHNKRCYQLAHRQSIEEEDENEDDDLLNVQNAKHFVFDNQSSDDSIVEIRRGFKKCLLSQSYTNHNIEKKNE